MAAQRARPGRVRGGVPIALALVCIGVVGARAVAADWPTWRCDARRSATSPQTLPADLALRWVLKLPGPRMAWPNEPRLHFDASYEPVVMGKSMFIGSPNDGSVSAFDTETGKRKWTFFTRGPVRFAPVACKDRVYVGSDDGRVYCLNAATGSVVWTVRGAPADRPDRWHLGNGRLISFWPIRGGPVLADGVVYFGAGIWATLGVFVGALDADTGRVLWRNGDLSYIKKVRIDHNALKDSGLSPQGYLVVVGDKLIVPNGRSMPAALDRKTGKLVWYLQGYRNGDCRVTAMGKVAMVGAAGVVDLETGREMGSRMAESGIDPAKEWHNRIDLFESPSYAYKHFPACTWRSALADGIAYGIRSGTFYAYDIARAKKSHSEIKHPRCGALKPGRWDAPLVWKFQAPHRTAGDVVLKAGSRLYGHAGRMVLAVDLPDKEGKPKLVWQHTVDGTPSTMLAADGKLLVVTQQGAVCCFASKPAEPVKPTVHTTTPVPPATTRDPWTKATAEILECTGTPEGYAVVLGIGSGRLITELVGQSKLRLIVVDADPKRVDALRRKLVRAGLYGTRVEAVTGEPFAFRLPPYLASLIVSEDLASAGFTTQVAPKRVFDLLRPYGGVACLTPPRHLAPGDSPGAKNHRAQGGDALEQWMHAAKCDGAEVRRAGRFVLWRRVGPLAGSDYWTHESRDAARTHYATDQRVRVPLGVLWYGDGADHGFYKRKDYDSGVKPQVIGGRVFAYQMLSRSLYAYDAFTGRVLWKRQGKDVMCYASMEDAIYVAEANRCVVLDPATGTPRRTFAYTVADDNEVAHSVSDVRVADDLVLISLASTGPKGKPTPKRKRHRLWDGRWLVALDRATGQVRWTRQAIDRFNNHAIVVGDGVVFCSDSASPTVAQREKRRGKKRPRLPSTILALDGRTGAVKWKAATTTPFQTVPIGVWIEHRHYDEWLAYSQPCGVLLFGKRGGARGFDAATGKPLWQKTSGCAPPLILRGKTFVTQSARAYDVRTGKPAGDKPLFGSRGGCNYAVGAPHLFLFRDRSACVVDAHDGKAYHLRVVRSGCSNSLIAADGVLNAPCFSVGCVCNYPIQTSFALVHMPEVADWAGKTPVRPERK